MLTAAHCTEDKHYPGDVEVLVGEHDITDSVTDRRAIAAITAHPNFDFQKKEFDFAILTLVSPLTFTTAVAPICLPSSVVSLNPDVYSDYSGQVATVTGWGDTSADDSVSDTLQEVDVKIMSNDNCKNIWGNQIKRYS